MSTPALPGGDATAGEAAGLRPLSNERIVSVLTAREFAHEIDEDGDVRGNWQGSLIYFLRIGQGREMLQVRALTATTFTIDQVPRLYAFCNSWNHDRLWPKAYVHVADDGSARVVGEVTADWEHGVSTAQLDQVMICGIATGCQLADAVAEQDL
jgi:hypothetical protein